MTKYMQREEVHIYHKVSIFSSVEMTKLGQYYSQLMKLYVAMCIKEMLSSIHSLLA